MRLYVMLAWRNLWRHRRRSIIVAVAMALGLGLMMFYDGLMAGFDQAIYGNAIKVLGGNIQVHAEGYTTETGQNPLLPLADDQAVVQVALAQPLVESASRRIITGGLLTSPEGAFGVNIIGIAPENEQAVNLAAQHVSAGRYLKKDDADMIFIGQGLADAMAVGVGDRITMVGRSTHDQMRQRTMTVDGIFDLGMPEYEKGTVYMSLAEAQSLFDLAGHPSTRPSRLAISIARQIADRRIAPSAALLDFSVCAARISVSWSPVPSAASICARLGGCVAFS